MRRWQQVAVVAATTMMSALGMSAGADSATAQQAQGDSSFQVASFNILGSQHTVNSTRWGTGRARARLALDWLEVEGTSVMGLQEAQVDQMRVITQSGVWESYPDVATARDTQTAQSVAWRASEWTMVRARTFDIPFHYTQIREQPMVLLQNRHSGENVWFISMHLTSGHNARALHERRVGTVRLVRKVQRLEATGVPVVVTGDMNEHEEFFCAVTAQTSLVSPAGGSNDGQCRPPSQMRIDWLFGTPPVQWSGFRFAQDAQLARVTDHTVPVATVTVPAQ